MYAEMGVLISWIILAKNKKLTFFRNEKIKVKGTELESNHTIIKFDLKYKFVLSNMRSKKSLKWKIIKSK